MSQTVHAEGWGTERRPAGAGDGRLAWEVLEPATGNVVHRGQRDVRLADIEVRVLAAHPPPQLRQLPRGLRPVAVDLTSWLVPRGRPRTMKRVALNAGFWLVLPERPGPRRPPGLALQAERDGKGTFCWEWFELHDAGSTATKLQETGALRLRWARNRLGHLEVVETAFDTDVSLRVMTATGPARREAWRVRVQAGSVVHWPQAADGIRLVPRLRPDRPS